MRIQPPQPWLAMALALLSLGLLGGGAGAVAAPRAATSQQPALTTTGTSTATATATASPTGATTVTPSATITATLTPEDPGLIGEGAGESQAPRIDGDLVVWEDSRNGRWDVFARDLASGREIAVTSGPRDARNPAISGNLVVWQQTSAAGDWDIYGARVISDVVHSFPLFVGPEDQTEPRVSGTQVVWQSGTPGVPGDATRGVGRWSIVTQDVNSSQPITITNGQSADTRPAIDGSTIIWQSVVPTTTLQGPAVNGAWDIMAFNVPSGKQFAVAINQNDKVNPEISANTVVWQEYISPTLDSPLGVGRWSLQAQDVTTGQPISVTQDIGDMVNPAIEGGTLVYEGFDSPTDSPQATPGPSKIKGFDFGGGGKRIISNSATSAGRPAISRGKVVWEQLSPAGHKKIFGTTCGLSFSDVLRTDYFYSPVRWLACSGALSGYGDGTFRPYNTTTRAQLAKIIVLSQGWLGEAVPVAHFSDVPPAHAFFYYIEAAYNHHVISGYADGSFRPNASVTRGQLAKIMVAARGWPIDISGGPHFADVAPGTAFYDFVETAYHQGVISGYSCGGPGEPCDAGNRPYFRQYNDSTRGQIAKIVYGALFQP
jgi:beta propeller repeat protein